MQPLVFTGAAFACLVSTAIGGPVEEAIVAAMRLSDRANYSWIATVDDDARTYDIIGQTSNAGYSRVRMPVVNAVRRRLGRSTTDNQVEIIFRGNVDCVLATAEGWKTVAELPLVADPEPILSSHGSQNRGSILAGPPGASRGGRLIRPAPKFDDGREPRSYSNLQLGLSQPHEELGILISSGTDLQADGDTLSGHLTELGAQLLLVRDGQSEVTPLCGSGTFTVWFRHGMVIRYQVKLEGVLAVSTGLGTRQIQVRQSTSTLIKDVGTTQVDVPAEVKQQLGD